MMMMMMMMKEKRKTDWHALHNAFSLMVLQFLFLHFSSRVCCLAFYFYINLLFTKNW